LCTAIEIDRNLGASPAREIEGEAPGKLFIATAKP
jgi:hypothetical protein